MDSRQSVLIVDQSPDSREVLRTVLEQRGLRILEASAAQQGLELARRHQPDLIVLDLELEPSGPHVLAGELAAQHRLHPTPVVILGAARRQAKGVPAGQFMSKPYHYAPLIRKIEELLEGIQRPAATS